MSGRVRKTAHAEADIHSISHWIARDSVDAALKWIDDLDAQLLKLSAMPGIGTDRSDLRPRLRSVAFGNYLIFFKPLREDVMVVRFVHGARDYAKLFAGE